MPVDQMHGVGGRVLQSGWGVSGLMAPWGWRERGSNDSAAREGGRGQ